MQLEQLKLLEILLDTSAARLPEVSQKRLFGCHALYRAGAVFALVWKTGRISLKLPDPDAHADLMRVPGAAPWVAHAVMSQWVLVPKGFHEDARQLTRWVRIAHKLAGKRVETKTPRAKRAVVSEKQSCGSKNGTFRSAVPSKKKR